LSKKQFEELMSKVGTTSVIELILYGDFNNWFAVFAFWVLWPQEIKDIEWGTEKMGGRRKRVYQINSAP
jgi:3-mercaptopyruvate sulfurtransferase SseA